MVPTGSPIIGANPLEPFPARALPLLGPQGFEMRSVGRLTARTLAPRPASATGALRRLHSGWPARIGVTVLAVLCTTFARAQPQQKTAESTCSVDRQTALDGLACELAAALNRDAAGAPCLVTAEAPGAPFDARGARALVERLTRLTAARLGPGARHHAEPVTPARARALAAPLERFVHLEPVLRAGRLEVSADEYKAAENIWRRAVDPQPKLLAHAFAARRADAEVRSFLPIPPLVASRIDRAPAPEREVVALACGDADADGNDEILYVARRRIELGRLRDGKFVPSAAADWAELSPIAPSPLRQPLAGAAVLEGRGLLVGSSDRAHAVLLTPSLSLIERLPAMLPWPSGGCSAIGELGIVGSIAACRRGDAVVHVELPEHIDALASLHFLDREGREHTVFAARSQADARVVLSDEARHHAELEALGAQLAWGDLDGDAVPELVASSDTLEPEHDSLRILSWRPNDAPLLRLELPVPDGVTAIAVCPWQGAGLAPVVVGTRKELWVIR